MRKAKNVEVEEAILLWFKQARTLNFPISGPLLMEKSLTLAKEMDSDFQRNTGWLERFKVMIIANVTFYLVSSLLFSRFTDAPLYCM